jgi:hypothetical protein
MSNCTFHPDREGTTELGIKDGRLGERVSLPICDECCRNYDDAIAYLALEMIQE